MRLVCNRGGGFGICIMFGILIVSFTSLRKLSEGIAAECLGVAP